MSSNTIIPIDKTSVHRICSGQVVLTLAVAVKELLENSLDAGSTVVEIKLKEYGSESIEVSDNGCGVHPDNFEGLTLKHHTSKLRDFSDIMSVETFGFRGEALSSLCALSNLSVTTRHESQNCGTNLVFDQNGHITRNSQCARQIGTTVSISNLFYTLPVRHKEFRRNLKREFTKMCQLLYAYCLVSTGVRISCVNQTNKGSRITIVSTQGSKNVKENIVCVFGAKQQSNLIEIKEKLPTQHILDELNISEKEMERFKLEGYISSCKHGEGRSANDRQFYYINSRPCEPSKVIKAVNEVYHQFNTHQSPFVYLNVKVERSNVDVNVTPDKRKIFLQHEKCLIATVKASLLAVFESIPSTFAVNMIQQKFPSSSGSNSVDKQLSASKLSLWRHKSDMKRGLENQEKTEIGPKLIKLDNLYSHISTNLKSVQEEEGKEPKKSLEPSKRSKIDLECDAANKNETSLQKSPVNEDCSMTETRSRMNGSSESKIESDVSDNEFLPDDHLVNQSIEPEKIHSVEGSSITEGLIPLTKSEEIDLPSFLDTPESLEDDSTTPMSSQQSGNSTIDIKFDTESELVKRKKCVSLNLDMDKLQQIMAGKRKRFNSNKDLPVIKFRAVIDPTKNDQAEQELNKEISKDMFSKMEIIGQFNLGFIIVKLDSDLFIIDQHATDEKYNFETLQKTTVISSQNLVIPQKLELTAVNECIFLENLEIFRKNGFEFKINESVSATKRISLTAVPMSRNWVFGKDDVDELLFMLQDSPNTLCRPSRVRAMFASRACRKSVMIGTALSFKDMRNLVNHMGEIEQPWNCPHGRPTMRHLLNLDLTR